MDSEKPKIDIEEILKENEKLKKICSGKSDVVSISVHQIRTSLSALKWIIKMFLDGDLGQLSPEQENLLRKAYEGNERAISVASDLLMMNKTENVLEQDYKISKIDLVELIDNTIFDFSGEAYTKGIEIIFLKTLTKEMYVSADKEKIRIVLQNLIENAIKYSNKHGKVFITLKEIDDNVQISIKDTGVGISEEGKTKIFEKFYRDPEAQKKEAIGSGIGLFTTKKIVETNGGKIWFESSPNEGTTFFFTLPIFR